MLKEMESIEERAEEYAVIAKMRGDMPLELAEEVYIEIATEQRKIDIDKACEWFAALSNDYFPGWREAFRKAMEAE